MRWMRRLYDWVLHWAETPYGVPALVLLSFAESSCFPIPPDVLLIALVVGAPRKWWRLALWCSVASVLGGMVGYLIGVVAWKAVGVWIVENIAHVPLVPNPAIGREDILLPAYLHWLGGDHLFEVYERWNAWIVFVFGLTPLPYKLVTITAGVARVNFPVFVLASIASRSIRFFTVSAILWKCGPVATTFIDKHFNRLAMVFVILLLGGFLILKFFL
ncbi:MAG TPA: DedA family protein [Firmicutes bacterium]|nr:DedA family protein [Bacillota bacterium]